MFSPSWLSAVVEKRGALHSSWRTSPTSGTKLIEETEMSPRSRPSKRRGTSPRTRWIGPTRSSPPKGLNLSSRSTAPTPRTRATTLNASPTTLAPNPLCPDFDPCVPGLLCPDPCARTLCVSHRPHHGPLARLAGATRPPKWALDVPRLTTKMGTIGWSAPLCLDAAEITIFIPVAPGRSEPGRCQNATQCLGLVSAHLEEQCAAGPQ